MALSIKDDATDFIVRRYARLKGMTYTAAIYAAVSEAIARESEHATVENGRDRIRRVQESVARYGVLDDRSANDIIGYDEHGLPT